MIFSQNVLRVTAINISKRHLNYFICFQSQLEETWVTKEHTRLYKCYFFFIPLNYPTYNKQ